MLLFLHVTHQNIWVFLYLKNCSKFSYNFLNNNCNSGQYISIHFDFIFVDFLVTLIATMGNSQGWMTSSMTCMTQGWIQKFFTGGRRRGVSLRLRLSYLNGNLIRKSNTNDVDLHEYNKSNIRKLFIIYDDQ